MAFPKQGGSALSAPRLLTVLASALLVGVALLSFTAHLPHELALLRPHRVALLGAGYGVLLAGVLLRRL